MFNEDDEYSGISWSYQWNSMFGWVTSWTYLRNVAFGEEKHRSEGRGNCEVCRLYLWGIAVLYMWGIAVLYIYMCGMQVLSAQKYLVHMSSLADNPDIRFQDGIGAFRSGHHNSRNVNAGNYISIEICVMLGHVVAQGGQNMQFTLTWMHPRGAHSVGAHSTGIICRRMAHIFISTDVYTASIIIMPNCAGTDKCLQYFLQQMISALSSISGICVIIVQLQSAHLNFAQDDRGGQVCTQGLSPGDDVAAVLSQHVAPSHVGVTEGHLLTARPIAYLPSWAIIALRVTLFGVLE